MTKLVRYAALASILGAASPALAADLPVKAPAYKAPVVVPFTWSGCYVGGYAGGAWGRGVDTADRGDGGVPWSGTLGHRWSDGRTSSVIGGGTLGCNYQNGPLVVGFEAEGGYIHLPSASFDPTAAPGEVVSSARIGDWYGAVTGRVGFAVDHALFYAKAGVAVLGAKRSVVDACNTGPCGAGLISATADNAVATWVAGGGLEYAWSNNWSVKAEYLYFGRRDLDVCSLAAGGPLGNFCWNQDLGAIHTVKLGINYRFDLGGERVTVKY